MLNEAWAVLRINMDFSRYWLVLRQGFATHKQRFQDISYSSLKAAFLLKSPCYWVMDFELSIMFCTSFNGKVQKVQNRARMKSFHSFFS